MPKKIVIVGGVAGGASAAARLRRLDEQAEIILFERGNYISFANCGLPYYIGGVIKERDDLLVQTKEDMEARFNIDIKINTEVTRVIPGKKEVEFTAADGEKGRENYDYLILSPGAQPLVPPIPGVDNQGIYTLRSMADVDNIKKYIADHKPKKAAVVGGGYVGIEMAENLKHAGMEVMLIEASEQVMAPLDMEMARIIEKILIDNGVKLFINNAVVKFNRCEGNGLEIILKNGEKIKADMVVLSAGVKPEVGLAEEAGLEIGKTGGIKVDEYLRTSDPYIYAVGDAVEEKDFVNGNKTLVPLAGPANKQGRIAADNICGRKVKYTGSQATSIIKVFDFTAAATGDNEKTLRRYEIPYIKSYTHSGSHAGYYPGAFVMSIKLLFSPEDGKILGAQVVGKEGVDKRIDIMAAALRTRLSVYDLEELELAYAPPYSSAKDPVNMAGYTAANILKGDMKIIHWEELNNLKEDEFILLDVRTGEEYKEGHIEGAVNIPVDNLRERIDDLPKDKKIIIYCKIGLRGYIAYRILSQKGFTAFNLSGGYDIFLAANYQYGEGLDLNEHMTKFEEKKPGIHA